MVNLRRLSALYKRWWHPPPPAPPYNHICQIGDPVLRRQASMLNLDDINSKEIQYIFKKMHNVMHTYGAVGLSAPQIGVPLRIFAIEFPEHRKKEFTHAVYKQRGMETIPFKIIVNPTLKVTNYEKQKFQEACESVRGYCAEVPRYKEVLVTGFSHEGEPISWHVSGWGARIVQHEMDHLNGRLFTDIMDRNSLMCTCWESVNQHSGRIQIPFKPK